MESVRKIATWVESILSRFEGAIWFFALLLFTHFTWKLAVNGDPFGHRFVLLGANLTAELYQLSCFTGRLSAWLMQTLGCDVYAKDDLLFLANGYTVRVIWGCTALKQLYMFSLLMVLYPGPSKAKLWYVPLGIGVLYVFNLFRIGAIPWLVGNDIYTFAFWHAVFSLSLYGLFFLLWLGWEEGVRPYFDRKQRRINNSYKCL